MSSLWQQTSQKEGESMNVKDKEALIDMKADLMVMCHNRLKEERYFGLKNDVAKQKVLLALMIECGRAISYIERDEKYQKQQAKK